MLMASPNRGGWLYCNVSFSEDIQLYGTVVTAIDVCVYLGIFHFFLQTIGRQKIVNAPPCIFRPGLESI